MKATILPVTSSFHYPSSSPHGLSRCRVKRQVRNTSPGTCQLQLLDPGYCTGQLTMINYLMLSRGCLGVCPGPYLSTIETIGIQKATSPRIRVLLWSTESSEHLHFAFYTMIPMPLSILKPPGVFHLRWTVPGTRTVMALFSSVFFLKEMNSMTSRIHKHQKKKVL